MTKISIRIAIILIAIIAALYFFRFRIDLTEDGRYSISQVSKDFLRKNSNVIDVKIYLHGDLNPGFNRLKRATTDMITDMSSYSKGQFKVQLINPSEAANAEQREQKYAELEAQGMKPTAIYERDKEGKAIQKIVFPWLTLTSNGRTIQVPLLKNIAGNDGETNLNISIENLEYEITDGLRRLLNTNVPKIAFIEGHNELTEAETYDISKTMSRYFQIDRGNIGNDAAILAPYKAIIIADPRESFGENEKYIIDQYIMRGGSVLWLVDGARLDHNRLATVGNTPAIDHDLNLADMFFKYGIRIGQNLLQDLQCVKIPVNIAPAGQKPQFEPAPWYFSPLLLTSQFHPITKNIMEVKAEFASSIEYIDDPSKARQAHLLLATSDNSRIIGVPSIIDLASTSSKQDINTFTNSYVPVAVLVEGQFESVFRNRMAPPGINNPYPFAEKSKSAKQIFVSNARIIRNETTGIASDSTTLPLGFDRYMNMQFGNRDFVRNAILYLTDDQGWLQLRERSIKMRLLNKQIIQNHLRVWQVLNVIVPLVILAIFGIVFNFLRKKKYGKLI